MRLKIRRAFYTLSVLNLLVFLVYLYGLASKVPSSLDRQVDRRKIGDQKPTTRLNSMTTSTTAGRKSTVADTLRFENRTSGNCSNLKRPVSVPDVQTWQKVDNRDNLYVFSAFYDDVVAQSPIIRMLGLSRSGFGPIFCQMWSEDKTGLELHETEGVLQRIPEDHGRKYISVYIKCGVPKNLRPYAVSIVTQHCKEATNYVPVVYPKKDQFDFSVCVTPFNFKYSRAYELVEMVEFNRIMGAGLVTFYNHSTGRNVDAILQHYQSEGSAEVVQWHLPMKVDSWPPSGAPEVHYFAQLAALNDCLYRNLHRSKYVVFTDMDEFIVPKKELNWTSLIQKKVAKNSNIGAFIIRCNFFRKDWPKYTSDFKGRAVAEKYRSILLLNVLRENKAFNHFQRSKYIVVPSRIETVGIHNIWAQRPGFIIHRMSASDALLHHYRNWENPDDGQKRVEDMRVHRYKDKLLGRLRQTWEHLPGVVLDIPLSNYSKPV